MTAKPSLGAPTCWSGTLGAASLLSGARISRCGGPIDSRRRSSEALGTVPGRTRARRRAGPSGPAGECCEHPRGRCAAVAAAHLLALPDDTDSPHLGDGAGWPCSTSHIGRQVAEGLFRVAEAPRDRRHDRRRCPLVRVQRVTRRRAGQPQPPKARRVTRVRSLDDRFARHPHPASLIEHVCECSGNAQAVTSRRPCPSPPPRPLQVSDGGSVRGCAPPGHRRGPRLPQVAAPCRGHSRAAWSAAASARVRRR